VPGRGEHVERKTVVDVQAEAVYTLKAGGVVSKPQLDVVVDVLKALKVEAGAAACRLQQSIGAGPDSAAR
jgi:glycyl-tRNA synthetase